MIHRLIVGSAVIPALAFSSAMALAEAEASVAEPSYMEAGIGLISQFLADYRGSNYYSAQALPLPYFLYSGPIFKVDKEGVRGELVASPRFELNVSVGGSLNGDADDNPLRTGMPELDSSFELGPSLNFNLSGEDFRHGWAVRLPLRAVFAFNSEGIEYVGYLIDPRLTWRKPNVFKGINLSFNLGTVWADGDYHGYYYEVAPRYVTPEREAFAASAGYSGSYLRWGFYHQVADWRFGASLRYDYLAGAVFEESPLVQTRHFASVSLGISKRFWSNR